MTDTWKNYTMIALTAVMLVSLGFNAMPEATHYCDITQMKAYCFDLSATSKTCYTLPAKTGGKQCSTVWQKIPLVPVQEECPICKEGICPICKEGTCPVCKVCSTCPPACPTCVQTCDGCGGGGGSGGSGGSGGNICPTVTCDRINVIAYTDSGKWFCNGIGKEADCVKDGTLEMPFK